MNIEARWAEFKVALQDKLQADRNLETARQRLQEALDAPELVQLDPNPVVERYSVPSRTQEGERHVVTVYFDGNITCTCEGFRFRKHCRHGGRVVGPTRENGTAVSVPA